MTNIIIALLMLIGGFILLVKGADFFVDGACGVAARFGIPEIVIGLTIAAMGTSAPEAAVSITSAVKGNAGIAVGNVLGSNIMNVLVILGIASVIAPIAIQKNTRRIEIPFVLAITIILTFLGYTGNSITFFEGVILWGLFICYIIYLFWVAKHGETGEENEEDKKWSLIVQLVAIIGGAAAIVFGSDFVVDGATTIAKAFNVSDRVIGLTIVAFGTSLPELVTSVNAAKKKKADLAIGNIVGSNIFNILFVIGTTALIVPVTFAANFFVDAIIAAATMVLLFVCVCNKDMKLKRWGGAIMLLAYAGYFVYLFV